MRKRSLFSLSIVFFPYWLMGQDCKEAEIEKLLIQSAKLIDQEDLKKAKLQNMQSTLIEQFEKCNNSKNGFTLKDSLKYGLLQNLIDICQHLGDIERQISFSQQIKTLPLTKTNDSLMIKMQEYTDNLERTYGDLRIRFENQDILNEMATLKNKDGTEVTISIDPPLDAWGDDQTHRGKKYKKDRLARLNYIKENSLAGKLEVLFDDYDRESGYFFFKISFVPFLDPNVKKADDWYSITFNEKKRYRFNFQRPKGQLRPSPLIIQPESNWILEKSTPDKWIKLSFPDLKQQIKLINRATNKKLSVYDYYIIEKKGVIDYYIPSNLDIDVVLRDKKRSPWILNKILYGVLIVSLSYYVSMGVH